MELIEDLRLVENPRVIEDPRAVEADDLGRDLWILRERIEAAHRCSVDVGMCYDLYTLALKDLLRGDTACALGEYEEADRELSSAINAAKASIKGVDLPSLKVLSFLSNLYGLPVMALGISSAAIFGYLINLYPDKALLGVPLWAAFFAGLGSSAQILTGVVRDIHAEGLVTRYTGLWYAVLPFLAMIFGYAAYLLLGSSLLSFEVRSLTSSAAFLCFTTGFMTNWMAGELSRIFDLKRTA